MTSNPESDLAGLLDELSAVQGELLAVLGRKRACLVAADAAGLAAIASDETALIARLQACHDRRGVMLAQASDEGRPAGTLHALAMRLPAGERQPMEAQMREARDRARLLQHESLTNWVIAQRTLLHLSQMLEIIATGGRIQPTYGSGEPRNSSGALLDHAA